MKVTVLIDDEPVLKGTCSSTEHRQDEVELIVTDSKTGYQHIVQVPIKAYGLARTRKGKKK